MDSVRGFEEDREVMPFFGIDHDDLDDPVDLLPPLVGSDERRMQVRAYNFWASMLGQSPLPLVKPLLDGAWPDFAANSVLLRFEDGLDDPAIAFVGQALMADCDADKPLRRLSDVPGRSILSRITDHYMQIVANTAPIGFEAEFVNQQNRTILYRGILLPFASDGHTLDHIYGVINWKELADQATTDQLMAEIGAVLHRDGPAVRRRPAAPVSTMPALPMPAFAEETTTAAPERESEQWGSLAQSLGQWADGPVRDRQADGDALELGTVAVEILPALDGDACDPAEPEPESLADWLASARAMAAQASGSEDRTRQALYDAIGRAWDFALAAEAEPDELAALVSAAGLTMQARAPLIPVVKLVFGAGYDKTRLTEYATALAHAHRLGLSRGELAPFLCATPGGLKGVVAAERRLRRNDEAGSRHDPRAALECALRTLPPSTLDALPAQGPEFALVLVRRLPGGDIAVLGEVHDDEPLIERAARRLVS